MYYLCQGSVEPDGSHPLLAVRVITLTASNGGEGGIGFAVQNLFETACGVPSPLGSVEPDGSHPLLAVRVITLTASNGGEGGIRTPGAISSTTDFESVTFGHSATSPYQSSAKE
jgi:3-deoxy-D-manno-octulosonate 8-phosphate phosphatase KdsC-like HAD superfamily phosphatase